MAIDKGHQGSCYDYQRRDSLGLGAFLRGYVHDSKVVLGIRANIAGRKGKPKRGRPYRFCKESYPRSAVDRFFGWFKSFHRRLAYERLELHSKPWSFLLVSSSQRSVAVCLLLGDVQSYSFPRGYNIYCQVT